MKSQLSNEFKQFANEQCEGSSPLYKALSLRISQDEEVLGVCLDANEGQPVPNLLFGAVQYMLMKEPHHVLRAFYPSLTERAETGQDAFPAFKEFVLTHHEPIRELLKTRRVQTNEVRRCAYLYPVFASLFQEVKKPLSLIEIGTSAGLQLLWDQYGYAYNGQTYSNQNAELVLSSEVKSGRLPLLPENMPPVAERVGVDLNVSDLTDEDDRLWLKALIWPEHHERRSNFDRASMVVRENPLRLIEGNGVSLLPDLAEKMNRDSLLCIFHTHVANQMPAHVREDLMEKVEALGEQRDTAHIFNNITDGKLRIDLFVNGRRTSQVIGETDGHGRWFEWRAEKWQGE
ncbi:hypothetical protein KP77_09080 [Jeotgalibacillus alimentarius]|uniref:DUF2332 domain-containing protein n=1 Tax=Jeotgalibacillus alimentarius TaxID=135826 RepID=A0A0C2W462_9BACL|nr:DUF2332 domain-containing protein [Jeotgalibacillus alimentarius]KIL51396.1 hypothetical protein KP77_09080 [Jeotgalibacillus alimentarius]